MVLNPRPEWQEASIPVRAQGKAVPPRQSDREAKQQVLELKEQDLLLLGHRSPGRPSCVITLGAGVRGQEAAPAITSLLLLR